MAGRFSFFAKTLLTLLCLVAWVVASNHCALASLSQQTAQETCCARANPEKGQAAHTQCCQLLQPVEQALAKAPGTPLVALLQEPLPFFAVAPIFIVQKGHDFLTPCDSPPAWSTVIDLQRCHPAFAPPFPA